jgi:hypothetical protein
MDKDFTGRHDSLLEHQSKVQTHYFHIHNNLSQPQQFVNITLNSELQKLHQRQVDEWSKTIDSVETLDLLHAQACKTKFQHQLLVAWHIRACTMHMPLYRCLNRMNDMSACICIRVSISTMEKQLIRRLKLLQASLDRAAMQSASTREGMHYPPRWQENYVNCWKHPST